jgi:hypothetical protein
VAARRWAAGLGTALLACAAAPVAAQDKAFERELYKGRFEHEVAFRAAAIQVAWGASPLCTETTEIEPFVLWSEHAMPRRPSGANLAVFREVTRMDERWRVVWMDEGAPDELRLGAAVTHVNGRPLPGGGTRFDMTAWVRGGSIVAGDDQAFWDVMLKARAEARSTGRMQLTLEGGRAVAVETQTGCAGAVLASGFDAEPDLFRRQGTVRVKLPASAMLEARSRDEFRWLAAFGTFFQASEQAVGTAREAEGRNAAFTVGKVLMLAVPGAGLMLSAAQAQTELALAVNGIAGAADLFANEVVAALGGDPAAGLALNRRLVSLGLTPEAVRMDEARVATATEHVRRLRALQAAAERAAAQAEAEERRRQEEALRQPLVIPEPRRP